MEKIELIKFTNEDACFIRENFPNYFRDNSIEHIEKIIEGWKEKLCFCILYENKKVGIMSLGEKDEGKLVWGVMIKEEYRNKGIAQNAFFLIKEKAKEKGYSTIISSCSKKNIASIRLHEKVGFVLKKTEINKIGNEMCRWEMKI